MSHFTNAPQAATHRLRYKDNEEFFTCGIYVGARRWTLRGNLMATCLNERMFGSTDLTLVAERPEYRSSLPDQAEAPYRLLQVGGDHYDKMPVDVFQFCEVNGLGFVESTAIKYIARRKSDSRIEDLKKAISCIERLIKHEETGSWER